MTSTAVDADLFLTPQPAPVDPKAALLAAVREPTRFRLLATPSGFIGYYVAEPTARNSEADALIDLAEAAEGLGYAVDVSLELRDPRVTIMRRSAVEHREPHEPECECGACFPVEPTLVSGMARVA